jgi:hypothetical protein
MDLDLEKVRANVRSAATEDLLDRATVYREGMEPAALDIIEGELAQRGVPWEAIAEHERKRHEEGVLLDAEGLPLTCCVCRRPAVVQNSHWHFVWGLVPVLRSRLVWCAKHKPNGT